MNDALCTLLIIPLTLLAQSCDETALQNNNNSNRPTEWLIPIGQIRDGGPGKDGIPALLNPETVDPDKADYLTDDDLLIGYYHNGEARAYPHKILDWHEIINDNLGGKAIAITYCPLTGTGSGWNRNIYGTITTFGVSGLLYNANLIPYDRVTDSNWTQIGLNCVNGELIGQEVETYQVVETTWKTWKDMFPNTTVISTNTGHSRDYQRYPYGSYRTSESLIFSVSVNDSRLPTKERVHGIIEDEKVRAYRFEHFGYPIITDSINNKPIVLVGSASQNFIVSFYVPVINEELLTFSLPVPFDFSKGFESSVILVDQFGNEWNLFGHAIAGPNNGLQLDATNSFMGYWFSWAPFYGLPEIYEP